MFDSNLRFFWLAILVIPMLSLSLAPRQAIADDEAKALSLVRKGMASYGDLDLDAAKSSLEKALTLGSQLSAATLARIHVSFGVIWSGGFADTAKGQKSFTIAACYDSNVAVDPLYLTPDIETEFKLAKMQAKPKKCKSLLADQPSGKPGDTPTPPPPPATAAGIALCGGHSPLSVQKRKFELPFFLSLGSDMANKVASVVVNHAFDAPRNYKELRLSPMSGGHGAMLSCNEGEIRLYDPSSIYYYIEGRDASGNPVCRHGSPDEPFQVSMMPDAAPVPPVAGMEPTECAPCAPWDEDCRKQTASVFLPGLGDDCLPSPGCDEGLVCNDIGICEMEEGGDVSKKGPEKFYVNLSGGTGFGIASGWTLKTANASTFAIEETDQDAGAAWSGIPLRLAVGFFLNPKFSIEATARFDMWMATVYEPTSCKDYESDKGAVAPNCAGVADQSGTQAADATDKGFITSIGQYAWLANVRAKYKVVSAEVFSLSLFGGLGYGKVQYRVPTTDNDKYFPIIGALNIELGPQVGLYFNEHFGVLLDIPIDIMLGNGFAVNFDFALGLGIGF